MTDNINIKDNMSSSDTAKWYVHCGENDIRGPCDTVSLKALLKSAYIDGYTNVWCDGMDAWKPISECNQLKELLIDSDDKEDDEYNNDNLLYNENLESSEHQDNKDNNKLNKNEEKENNNDDKEKDKEKHENEGNLLEKSGNEDEDDEVKKRKKEKKKQYLKRKKQRIESGQWVDSSKNYSVYVSGLPKDTTMAEVAEVFKKAGIIKIDPLTTLPKIKLYTDENGELKSDGTVTFVNKESIDFAIRYLDNYHFRENCIIHVEQAKYEPRNNQQKSIPASVKAELRKKYLAAKYEEERLLSWSDNLDDGTGRRIVISKPMFSMEDAMRYEAGDEFYKDLKEEILEEISKYVEVEKVTPIARHPQGVVCIKFKNSSDAEVFISKFNNRIFDGRQLEVYFFDGKTDLQSQTIPSKMLNKPETKVDKQNEDELKCDWIEQQSSDEEFEINTE